MLEYEAAERELRELIERQSGHRPTIALIPGRDGGQPVWLGVASVPGQSWRVLRRPDGTWCSKRLMVPGS